MNSTSNDATSEWRARRKKYISRRTMRGLALKGRMRFGKGRAQQKVTQLIQEAQNDGNTSNSENSEGSPLYNEIDWEENLACDSTLVDEFAPRPQKQESSQPTCSAVLEPSVAIPMPEEIENDFEDLSLAEGAEIFVRFNLANDNPEWLAAIVVEVDQEEEELLIKYTEGNPPPPMEWMNPTSNRIRRSRPQQPKLQSDFSISSDMTVPSLPSPEPDISKIGEIKESAVDDSAFPPSPQALPSPLTFADKPPLSASKSPEPPLTQDLAVRMTDIRPIRPGGSRSRGSWRRKRGTLLQRDHHTGSSKFVEGEKVLAKWSDHRMQKFPAVIKSILNDGKYDVLFYDGFEKTISEDHIFKTTEEEMAKYEHMNPSEADSFDHMDLDSKEARRQRKKKTFDDYVFARDYKIKRRVMKSGERFTMARKLAFQLKGNADGSLSGGDQGESDKPVRQKKIRRKRRFLVGPKRDSRLKMQMDHQRAPSSSVETASPTPPSVGQESENFYGFDSDPAVPEIAPKTEPFEDPRPTKIDVPEPVVIKREPTEDRWKPSENQNYKPIEINRDGVTRKSLVVPDNNLLPGWSKHAVVSTTNNLWDVILLSPEGYQINNVEELKEYFDMKNDGASPPASLDFLADFNVLAELALKQRDIPAAPTPKIWRRGGRGGRRGGRGHMSSSARGRTGVRTLLPKCRFQEPSSPVTSMPQPPSSNLTENEFRCPKEGCDKKFRKESLLQMHIKHYHRELSTLAHSAPNMVDLACARSESVNSDWKTSTDLPKPPSSVVKKQLPRSFPSSPIVNDEHLPKKNEQGPESHLSPNQSNSRVPDRSLPTETPSSKRQPTEERRTTIKTMLPIRPSDIPPKSGLESDEVESEDEYIEQKKNGSRIFKPGKFRRGSRLFTGMRVDDSIGESLSNQLPAFKFTKKRKADRSISDSYDVYHDEDKLSSSVEMNDDGVVIERLKSEEFINCICGFREEDGLMIQCDICMCWQHGVCSGIENESDVPERYICSICRNPFRVRSAKKYAYAQHYLTQGKLPTFNFRTRNDEEIAHREMILKRCFELTANVLEIKNVDRSLAAKINIAEKADHPKLYMWAKNWEETESKQNSKLSKDLPEGNNGENQSPVTQQPLGPQPEAPIDLEECRIRLLDHVEHGYSQIEDRLTSLQAQIAALESLDPDLSSSSANDKVTKQTIQMLIRDLETLNKLAAIS